MQIWKNSKYAFQEKQGRGGRVRQSGKFPDYTGFFLLKASLIGLPKENNIFHVLSSALQCQAALSHSGSNIVNYLTP